MYMIKKLNISEWEHILLNYHVIKLGFAETNFNKQSNLLEFKEYLLKTFLNIKFFVLSENSILISLLTIKSKILWLIILPKFQSNTCTFEIVYF